MGRPRKNGKRVGNRLSRALEAMLERNAPGHVISRRELFSFVVPEKGPDGRGGTIDQDICDGIGQLHALGLLGEDGRELRDCGRFFGQFFWARYRDTAPGICKYERADRSVSQFLGETANDRRFDRMDAALSDPSERSAVMSLVVDCEVYGDIVPWAQSLIDEGLLERGKIRKGAKRFTTMNDRAMLELCIAGLEAIAGGEQVKRAA